MGFALGAAIGAKLANPKRPVLVFTGDGSFRMNSSELATLSAYKIPVLIILINNKSLGMVRQWQQVFHGGRYSETELGKSPDFCALAASYGISAYRAETGAAFTSALASSCAEIARGRTALIEAVIDNNEMVLPMVPGGKAVDEQIL
jgi:acetolactate synthase-1/2/3 large subunit